MSVWIEDMELPKECYQCQFSYVNSYNQRICSRLDRECCDQFYCGDNGRLDNCPIHELPASHGDLIDKDDMFNISCAEWDVAKQEYSEKSRVFDVEDFQNLSILISADC